MPNFLGFNTDLLPNVNVTQALNNAKILPPHLAAARTVNNILNPDVDMIKGIGPNEMRRNAVPTGAQVGNTGGSTEQLQPLTDPYSGNIGSYADSAALAAAKVGDAATTGQYDQLVADLERQLGLFPGQLEAGLNQINDGFNKGLSRLNEQQSNALTRFRTQRNDTRGDFDDSLGDIDTQARGNYQAIQALLGRSGAGSSSAASVLAPHAVSTESSKTRSKVADVYGRNLRDLDMAEEETNQSYENNKRDLEDQKRTSEYGLRSGIDSQKSKTLSSLAEAQGNRELSRGANWETAKNAMGGTVAKRNEIDAALSTLLNQYRNPYTVKDVAAREAKLSNYAVDANGVKIEGGQSSDSDTSAQTQAQIKAEEERKKREGVTA